MGDQAARRHSLYYPYFNVRDEAWLRAAALYWPRIVSLVPPEYRRPVPTRTELLLTEELAFIQRVPPGPSVQAVAPLLLDVLRRDSLRELRPLEQKAPARLGLIYAEELDPSLRDALVDGGFAITSPHRQLPPTAPDWADHLVDIRTRFMERPGWMAMDTRLIQIYKSVLAENFAAANQLQPTTDQELPFAVTNRWDADRIEAALLGEAVEPQPHTDEQLGEMLAYLALELVVPDHLEDVPIEKIIELRRRHGDAFQAFGARIDEVAASIAGLGPVRDPDVLNGYLHDMVEAAFAQPLSDLRKRMQDVKLSAVGMAVNVKLEIPAGIAAIGGTALLAGHPATAATASAAIGVLALGRSTRAKRDAELEAAPVASFLLHTEHVLSPPHLLRRSIERARRVMGGGPG